MVSPFLAFKNLQETRFCFRQQENEVIDEQEQVDRGCCRNTDHVQYEPPQILLQNLKEIAFFSLNNPGSNFDSEPIGQHLAVGQAIGDDARLLFSRVCIKMLQ